MGIYYIETDDGTIFELTSTTEVVVQRSGKTTDFVVEEGSNRSDHYINLNTTASFRGTVSDVISNPNNLGTQDYIGGLEKLKESKELFTFYWASEALRDGEKSQLQPLENCVFERLDTKQDSRRGYFGSMGAFSVDISIKQVRVGKGAQSAEIPSDAFSNDVKEKGNQSSSFGNPENEEQDTLLQQSWAEIKAGGNQIILQ